MHLDDHLRRCYCNGVEAVTNSLLRSIVQVHHLVSILMEVISLL